MNKHKNPPATKFALLRRVPALRACSDRELAEVARLVDETTVDAGTVLMTEGSIGQEAFVIVGGWAAVMVHGEPVAALGPGEIVGELSMLDHQPRSATVVAKTEMELLAIGPRAFGAFVQQPAVARQVRNGLVSRLRNADAAIAGEGDAT